jgi:hypothetical protein
MTEQNHLKNDAVSDAAMKSVFDAIEAHRPSKCQCATDSITIEVAGMNEFLPLLKEIESFIGSLSDRPVDLRDSVIKFFEAIINRSVASLFTLDDNLFPASVANKLSIGIKPSQFLSDLLAAIKAGDSDVGVFKNIAEAHGVSPLVVDVSAHTVGENGADVITASALNLIGKQPERT